ncbi:MAG: molybdopterin-synthase adenylyltransferase MoeB, partial [Caldimicrobium sp.]|nr:molybdopterin-synthase adenylyltransferase MoeB [Caldimicrobium sp.]MDW8182651.1 molybdopterin-synthase adenylyltransferase MoeB [Caldimicrobium sp.]
TLSKEEIYRYSRHLLIPEVGIKGQRRLKASKVLIIGTGGLGSPVALYLAAAGVGKLGLVDYDTVDESNLQRQILHSQHTIGVSKVESAKERLLEINPYIEIETYPVLLNRDNVWDILKDYDLVIDGTDNFPTRYLLNDALYFLNKPLIYGSIFRFEGQVTVFHAQRGPCYRCLYPEPPPPGTVPSCAEGGVFGVLPGVIGALQATEAIKILLGIGKPLIGKLLLYDALHMEFRQLNLRKDPHCPLCGERPTIRELVDYEDFCGVELQPSNPEYEISPQELKEKLSRATSQQIIDVREPHEWEICNLPGSLFISLEELPSKIAELDPTKEYVVVCKVGKRSYHALELLLGAGLKAYHLKGGLNAYAKEVDPEMPLY